MKLLILGDIYGEDGKIGVASYLPFMKERLSPDVVIANAENTSQGGKGLTEEDYHYLMSAGVDYFTMGNHTFRNKDIYNYINKIDNMVRPANELNINDGVGHIIFKVNNKRVLLFNLLGSVFIQNKVSNPFQKADEILELEKDKYDLAILDIHAEATAEKIVLANYLSKKGVGIIFGTHTHIQTSDERIINDQTAYITDVGMCGVFNSAIGADFEAVEEKFKGTSSRLSPFKEAKGNIRINAILVTLYDNTCKPMSIERITINP